VTVTLSATSLDPRAAAIATINRESTLTATHWTATPTNDLPATINAERTRIIEERLAENATQTANFVASYTKTPTLTHTPTFTPTFTFTPTLTFTPVPTGTPLRTSSPVPQVASVPTLIPAGTDNDVWTPVERDFDGVPMVLVPAGCFMMGSEMDADEKPIHQQCFENPFWIDKFEVTNRQFEEFDGRAGRSSNWTTRNQPRDSITWFEATMFCQSRWARLPTEAEWEYAARGPEALIYPWGNQFIAANVVYDRNSNKRSAPIASRPDGASWVGAQDMNGNVWEWVSTIFDLDKFPYPYSANDGRENPSDKKSPRIFRGGSWFSDMDNIGATDRFWVKPTSEYVNGGFRCARDY
jgi:formylglycine-generating enzyme required for sulfatase activity